MVSFNQKFDNFNLIFSSSKMNRLVPFLQFIRVYYCTNAKCIMSYFIFAGGIHIVFFNKCSYQWHMTFSTCIMNGLSSKLCNSKYIHVYIHIYCILRGRIKGLSSSITTIMCQAGSYRTGWVVIEC